MIDTTKLRELAQKSTLTAENRDDYSGNYGAFIAAANPATVLALLARGQEVVIEYATISA